MTTPFTGIVRLVAFLVLASCAQSLYADQLFDFQFKSTITGQSGGGTLTTNLVSGDEYLVTGISGSVNGSAITGLLPAPSSFTNNDNDVYFPPGSCSGSTCFLDVQGLGFTVGSTDYQLDWGFGEYEVFFSVGPFGSAGGLVDSFTLTPAPEPSSPLLLGTGLVGLWPLVRRRVWSA